MVRGQSKSLKLTTCQFSRAGDFSGRNPWYDTPTCRAVVRTWQLNSSFGGLARGGSMDCQGFRKLYERFTSFPLPRKVGTRPSIANGTSTGTIVLRAATGVYSSRWKGVASIRPTTRASMWPIIQRIPVTFTRMLGNVRT